MSLALRGLHPIPPTPGQRNVLWVISHPEDVDPGEFEGYDLVCAASTVWSAEMSARTGREVVPLLQATEFQRPAGARPTSGPEASVVFVGTNLGKRERPLVWQAVEAGIPLSVYGPGWDGLPEGVWQGEYVANAQLPELYRRHGIVLADHWPDMAQRGFIANRVFDAVACGAAVISDDVVGLHDVFDPEDVVVVRTAEEMRDAVARLRRAPGRPRTSRQACPSTTGPRRSSTGSYASEASGCVAVALPEHLPLVAALEVVALLEDDQVVVAVHGPDVAVGVGRLVGRRQELLVVEPVHERLHEGHRRTRRRRVLLAAELRPVRRLGVLDGVERAVREQREQELEGGEDVRRPVAAVVDDHLRDAEPVEDALQRGRVGLVGLHRGDARPVQERLVLDVEAHDLRLREVALPHAQGRAALLVARVAAHADLEQDEVLVAQVAQVPLVVGRVEVDAPLVGAGAGGDLGEVGALSRLAPVAAEPIPLRQGSAAA